MIPAGRPPRPRTATINGSKNAHSASDIHQRAMLTSLAQPLRITSPAYMTTVRQQFLMSDMEPCPTCKNDVSKNATECPNCGENIKNKKDEIKQKQKVENFEKWWSDHPIIKKSVMASSIALCLVLLGWCAREQHIYEQAKERADLRDCDEAGKTAAGWSDTLYRACVERNEDKIQAAMRQMKLKKTHYMKKQRKSRIAKLQKGKARRRRKYV